MGDPAVPLGQREGNHSENLFPLQESSQPSSHAPPPPALLGMGSKQIVFVLFALEGSEAQGGSALPKLHNQLVSCRAELRMEV